MQKRYGRYEVLYQLGQGAMAVVHLARDPLLGRFVAIKVLHHELTTQADVLNRFFKEARVVAAVRHPHVVEVFDFGQEGQDMYLVMEFVDGQSLGSILNQLRIPSSPPTELVSGVSERPHSSFLLTETVDEQVVAALLCQAAEGLSMAARQGVVHRDIKPENMMIDQQGYLKISDFGIAHVQDDSLTKTGAILGSPHYMAPEQARGFKPITSQADMFSLGAVFYACLAGHPPFQGKSLPDLFRKIVSEPHVPLWRLRPNLDPYLINLVDTLLQKDPAQRGGGPKWLHRQLQGYLLNQGVVDPAERVCTYLQGLSAKGVQTTWRSNSSRAGLEHTQRTLKFSRESRPVLVKAWPMPAMFALGIAAVSLVTALIWIRMGHSSGNRVAAASPIVPAETQTLPVATPPTAQTTAPLAMVGSEALLADDTAGLAAKASGDSSTASGDRVNADTLATLLLQSSPPFAEVYVDGRYAGPTPVKVQSLASGRHRIVIKGKHTPALDTLLNLSSGTQAIKFIMGKGPATRLAGAAGDDT